MFGWILSGIKYFLLVVLGLIITASMYIMAVNLVTTPKLDRNWTLDQKILPTVSWSGSTATIAHVRNFEYRTTDDYTPRYYTGSYKLEDLETAYYIIEPFSEHTGPAHTMISFGFKGGQYVTVSAEIRKEVGESFGAVNGLLAQYELVYIIGDERDLVGLRANYRKDRVFMYPVRAPIPKLRALFTDMVNRADTLGRQPEWYNLIWNTCTTSILAHINALREEPIGWTYKIFLPYYSDEVAFENDLIDTSLPLDQARIYYQINDLAAEFANDLEFSIKIRKERK